MKRKILIIVTILCIFSVFIIGENKITNDVNKSQIENNQNTNLTQTMSACSIKYEAEIITENKRKTK